MLPLHLCLLLAFSAWLLCLAATALALPPLRRAAMDMPSARSNHTVPTPRGGGIAMSFAILLCLPFAGAPPLLIVGAAALMAVSFVDDLRGLPILARLSVQMIAVAACIHLLPGRILPEFMPYAVEWGLVFFYWLWFINLTNFMDGIDGITVMETISVTLGIALVAASVTLPPALATQSCILAAAAFGFYAFNRPPAKLFMGDSGSIPLGFLTGFLLYCLAAKGAWAAAMILPAYYLTDAKLTLLKRILRGEKFWQAHSQHAYQIAVRAGLSHASVVRRIALLNAALVALAMLSTLSMMAALASVLAAYLLTLLLIYRFLHAPVPR